MATGIVLGLALSAALAATAALQVVWVRRATRRGAER